MKLLQPETSTAISQFTETYGRLPDWKVIAPGRVNLIGEHTDYNLLPVLPMPLDRTITLWVAPRTDNLIRLTNCDSNNFSPAEISLEKEIEPIPHHWTNYARAAARALLPQLCAGGSPVLGFDALVQSDLPTAAGLSSSSALVIATCLALLHVNHQPIDMAMIAEQMRLAEQFVGTAGGGMDQAVISLGKPGSALMVDFDPLTVTPVPVPNGLRIYVIDSGLKAEKSGAARYAFNLRALECTLAVELMQGAAGYVNGNNGHTLRDVYVACAQADVSWKSHLLTSLAVDPVPYDYIIDRIGALRFQELCESKKLNASYIHEWLPGGRFSLYARATHVLGEADRVNAFANAMSSGDLASVYHHANASHASCRDLYHISTPGIETLIAKTEAAGACAARITGAGFGGCIVAFVPAENAEHFAAELVQAGVDPERIIAAESKGAARTEPV